MRRHQPSIRSTKRRGLAPLEMVLSLPLMLFIMALMVIFGAAGAWKIRALVNSRHAVWRTITPRTGGNDAHPAGWPTNAQLSRADANPNPFPSDPFAVHQVVRGPTLFEPDQNKSLDVFTQTLSIEDGLEKGFARIVRDFALLQGLPPGEIDFPRDHLIYSGTRWQIVDMGIANSSRRILRTYDFQLEGHDPEATQRYQQSEIDNIQVYADPGLFVLDRDQDLAQWRYGQGVRFNPGFDFYPRPDTSRCEMDPSIVEQLVLRIKGGQDSNGRDYESVPETMSRTFIRMYQDLINQLEAQDPIPPSDQALIDEYQEYIDQLNEFLATFP